MHIVQRVAIVGLTAAGLGLALSACGGDGDAASPSSPSTSNSAVAIEFNDRDVTFAQGMIPHHAQAVEMAALALVPERGASAEVQDLAQRIQAAQDPEIEQMTEWLMSWDQPIEMPMTDGMEMDGMVAADDLRALAELSAAEFDAEWTRLMIAHHDGAIAMAKTEITDGLNTDMVTLAGDIVDAQEAEIDEMR